MITPLEAAKIIHDEQQGPAPANARGMVEVTVCGNGTGAVAYLTNEGRRLTSRYFHEVDEGLRLFRKARANGYR